MLVIYGSMEVLELKTGKLILLSLLLGIVLALVSTVRFETVSIPDLVVTKYGFPLFWLHHQTISIAGSIDLWSFEWLNFIIDFVFWFVVSVLIVLVLQKYRKK